MPPRPRRRQQQQLQQQQHNETIINCSGSTCYVSLSSMPASHRATAAPEKLASACWRYGQPIRHTSRLPAHKCTPFADLSWQASAEPPSVASRQVTRRVPRSQWRAWQAPCGTPHTGRRAGAGPAPLVRAGARHGRLHRFRLLVRQVHQLHPLCHWPCAIYTHRTVCRSQSVAQPCCRLLSPRP